MIKLKHHVGLPLFVLIDVTDKMVHLVAESSILGHEGIVLIFELVEKTEKLVVKRAGFKTSIARLGGNKFLKMSGSWVSLVTGKADNFIELFSVISTVVDPGLECRLFSQKVFSILNIHRSDIC